MTERQFYRAYCAAMAELRGYLITLPTAYNYGSIVAKTRNGVCYEVGALSRIGTTDEGKEKQRYAVLSEKDKEGAADDLLQILYPGRVPCGGSIILFEDVAEVCYEIRKVIR